MRSIAILVFAFAALLSTDLPAHSAQRPFYVIAHRVNNPHAVAEALRRGANAVEIDVQCARPGEFHVNHDASDGPPVLLDAFLAALGHIAAADRRLALAVFDVKTACGDPRSGALIMRAMRRHLPRDLNVIVSADTLAKMPLLIAAARADRTLRPNEAVGLYRESDPASVARAFRAARIDRFAFADGVFETCPCPWLHEAIARTVTDAARSRRRNGPRFVYAWTVARQDHMRRLIAAGVDGIEVNLGAVAALLREVRGMSHLSLARRSDRPFTRR